MFKQYHPNVKAVIQLLRLLKVKISDGAVDETLQDHPDWPSMLSITDCLTRWQIPNGVGKIDPGEIELLQAPFIVYFPGEEVPLGIVTTVTEQNVSFYNKSNTKTETLPRAEFIRRWEGVYLLAEPNERSGEIGYRWRQARENLFSFLLIGIPATVSILAIFLIHPYGNGLAEALFPPAAVPIQYFILLSGIFVTSLLLWYEIDTGNPLLRKVCSSIKQGNCSQILNSQGAKLFPWLSWSEVGFFYFTGGALSLLFIKSSLFVVATFNLLALPYIFYSIYYQARVVRTWCILCLFVQLLLVLGGINIVASGLITAPSRLTVSIVSRSLLVYMIPMYVWAMAKPVLVNMQNSKYMRREYLRIKFNGETFTSLLNTQKTLVVSSAGLGIELGNPRASNEIIKVCNPYCGACIRTHPKVEELLEKSPDLKVRIIFRTSANVTDPSINLVKHFLAIDAGRDISRTKTALDSWYLSDRKDYDTFKQQFEMNGQLEKQTSRWEEMNRWCKAADITFTPTFFFNGRQLPDVYNIDDIQYFLLE